MLQHELTGVNTQIINEMAFNVDIPQLESYAHGLKSTFLGR